MWRYASLCGSMWRYASLCGSMWRYAPKSLRVIDEGEEVASKPVLFTVLLLSPQSEAAVAQL
jgi:hypothetical protein